MPTAKSVLPPRASAKKPSAPIRKREGAGDRLLAQTVFAPSRLERPPAPAGSAAAPPRASGDPKPGKKKPALAAQKPRSVKPAGAAPRAKPPALVTAPVNPAPKPSADGSSALARIEQMARAELADIDGRIAALVAERQQVVGVLAAIGGSVEPAPATPPKALTPAVAAPAVAAHAPAVRLPEPVAMPAQVPAPPSAPPAMPPGLAAAEAALSRPSVTQPVAVLAVLDRATTPLTKPQIFDLVRHDYPQLSLSQATLNTVVQRLRKDGKIKNAAYGQWIVVGRAPAAPTPAAAPEAAPAVELPADGGGEHPF